MKRGSAEAGNEIIELTYGNLKLVLDQQEIYPDDPGQGTPAMIHYENREGHFSSTYWCWEGEGDIDGHQLTDAQNRWLESKSDYVNKVTEEWYNLAEAKKGVK